MTARFNDEWVWAGLLVVLNLLVLAHAALALSARDGWRERAFNWLEQRAGWLVAIAGFAGAVMMLALVFDPRYRSFPSAALVLPALVYLVRPVTGPRREIALLAFIIGAGIAPQLYREGVEPAGVGLGDGECADGCGFVALLAGAQGLRPPS